MSGKVDLIYTDPNVLNNHLIKQQQNPQALISVHILPQTRRESYIASNINTSTSILKKLKSAAYKLQADPDYQYYLAYKPLIKE